MRRPHVDPECLTRREYQAPTVNAGVLGATLNRLSQEGWRVDEVLPAATPGEFVVVASRVVNA